MRPVVTRDCASAPCSAGATVLAGKVISLVVGTVTKLVTRLVTPDVDVAAGSVIVDTGTEEAHASTSWY